MAYKDILLTKSQGKIVIENFKTTLSAACERLSKRGRNDVGILSESRGLFTRLDDLEEEYGSDIVGTALEIKRRQLVINDPTLYYEASSVGLGPYFDEMQDDWVYELLYDLTGMCNEISEELEEERKREDEEPLRTEHKPTQEEIEGDYKKELRKLKNLINRRKKFGLEMVDISIPKVPKKITKGSIRRLQKLSQKVKTKYGYLGGGRYKGMKK